MRGKLILTISALAVMTVAPQASAKTAVVAPCDRACLLEHAKQFNANMLAHTTAKIPLGWRWKP